MEFLSSKAVIQYLTENERWRATRDAAKRQCPAERRQTVQHGHLLWNMDALNRANQSHLQSVDGSSMVSCDTLNCLATFSWVLPSAASLLLYLFLKFSEICELTFDHFMLKVR